MKSFKNLAALGILLALHLAAPAQSVPQGEVSGTAAVHTAESARAAIDGGMLVLPSSVTGGAVFAGKWIDAPRPEGTRVPVVVFLHGSSGLGLPAIGEWQRWLAGMNIASFAPDSFALPGRITYKSPVSREVYEKIHALRGSEIALALQAVAAAPWADASRLVLAGTSEGAVAVARYTGGGFAGRMVYSWSCEDNYFVEGHRTAFPAGQPVLNVMSSTDVFFSPSNAWLGNREAAGHCGRALKDSKRSAIVLVPGAPHTLLNLPQARHATAGYLHDLFGQ